tara:strand:- start:10042 stop:11301 length:1260 start_codon:yes stop_codon:yes gene_type:complete
MKNLFLAAILISSTALAEELTTNNLITNGTFEGGNSTSWTTTGDVTVLNDCCGSSYDLEFGDSGSIEQGFALTTDTITQQMLNNGITLNSSVQVQNGECGVAQCWGGSGPADTFTIRLQIRDSDNNVLAVTSQERTNVTGINGKDFNDSVSYTGVGSNIGNIFISGSDGNSPAYLGGPNLDNISVTMTYDDTVLSATETAIIAEAFEEIEEVLATEIEIVEIEELIEVPSIVLTSEVEFTQIEEYLPEVKTVEEEFVEETIVLATEVVEELPIEEPIEIAEEVYEEVVESPTETVTEEMEVAEETETIESVEPTTEEEPRSSNSERVNVDVNVEEIAIRVADKIKSIDGQLKVTQMIVAKAMQKNNEKLNDYAKVNLQIFVQPELTSANIDSYIATSYVDIRSIYSGKTYEDRLWTLRQ